MMQLTKQLEQLVLISTVLDCRLQWVHSEGKRWWCWWWRQMRQDEGGRCSGRERARGTLSVCVHTSVSWVCRGGQGNKSEQREVMRFGCSAAVINTTLGSNTGHTFGQVGWENTITCYQILFLSFSLNHLSFFNFCSCIFFVQRSSIRLVCVSKTRVLQTILHVLFIPVFLALFTSAFFLDIF